MQFGLVVMLHLTFYHGGTCVVLPKFDLPTALNAVQKYKCTVSFGLEEVLKGIAWGAKPILSRSPP